jgi:hypothetical protein
VLLRRRGKVNSNNRGVALAKKSPRRFSPWGGGDYPSKGQLEVHQQRAKIEQISSLYLSLPLTLRPHSDRRFVVMARNKRVFYVLYYDSFHILTPHLKFVPAQNIMEISIIIIFDINIINQSFYIYSAASLWMKPIKKVFTTLSAFVKSIKIYNLKFKIAFGMKNLCSRITCEKALPFDTVYKSVFVRAIN